MYDMPQYRWILIPEFEDGKSAMVFKIYHSMSDGMGIATFFQAFNDDYNSANLPAVRPLPAFKQFGVHLLSPFLVLREMYVTATAKVDINSIKKPVSMSGKKTLGYIKDLGLPQMKEFCRKKRCTIGDYCNCLLSISLFEYFSIQKQKATMNREKAYDIPETLRVSVPFSLRQPYKNVEDVIMNNDIGSMIILLPVQREFDQALKDI